jgi:hypothetical protein
LPLITVAMAAHHSEFTGATKYPNG